MKLNIDGSQENEVEEKGIEGHLKKIRFHIDRMVDSATNEINISTCNIHIGSATGPWRTDSVPSDVRDGKRSILARWGHNTYVATCSVENNKYMWVVQPSNLVCARCDPNAWAEIFLQEEE